MPDLPRPSDPVPWRPGETRGPVPPPQTREEQRAVELFGRARGQLPISESSALEAFRLGARKRRAPSAPPGVLFTRAERARGAAESARAGAEEIRGIGQRPSQPRGPMGVLSEFLRTRETRPAGSAEPSRLARELGEVISGRSTALERGVQPRKEERFAKTVPSSLMRAVREAPEALEVIRPALLGDDPDLWRAYSSVLTRGRSVRPDPFSAEWSRGGPVGIGPAAEGAASREAIAHAVGRVVGEEYAAQVGSELFFMINSVKDETMRRALWELAREEAGTGSPEDLLNSMRKHVEAAQRALSDELGQMILSQLADYAEQARVDRKSSGGNFARFFRTVSRSISYEGNTADDIAGIKRAAYAGVIMSEPRVSDGLFEFVSGSAILSTADDPARVSEAVDVMANTAATLLDGWAAFLPPEVSRALYRFWKRADEGADTQELARLAEDASQAMYPYVTIDALVAFEEVSRPQREAIYDNALAALRREGVATGEMDALTAAQFIDTIASATDAETVSRDFGEAVPPELLRQFIPTQEEGATAFPAVLSPERAKALGSAGGKDLLIAVTGRDPETGEVATHFIYFARDRAYWLSPSPVRQSERRYKVKSEATEEGTFRIRQGLSEREMTTWQQRKVVSTSVHELAEMLRSADAPLGLDRNSIRVQFVPKASRVLYPNFHELLSGDSAAAAGRILAPEAAEKLATAEENERLAELYYLAGLAADKYDELRSQGKEGSVEARTWKRVYWGALQKIEEHLGVPKTAVTDAPPERVFTYKPVRPVAGVSTSVGVINDPIARARLVNLKVQSILSRKEARASLQGVAQQAFESALGSGRQPYYDEEGRLRPTRVDYNEVYALVKAELGDSVDDDTAKFIAQKMVSAVTTAQYMISNEFPRGQAPEFDPARVASLTIEQLEKAPVTRLDPQTIAEAVGRTDAGEDAVAAARTGGGDPGVHSYARPRLEPVSRPGGGPLGKRVVPVSGGAVEVEAFVRAEGQLYTSPSVLAWDPSTASYSLSDRGAEVLQRAHELAQRGDQVGEEFRRRLTEMGILGADPEDVRRWLLEAQAAPVAPAPRATDRIISPVRAREVYQPFHQREDGTFVPDPSVLDQIERDIIAIESDESGAGWLKRRAVGALHRLKTELSDALRSYERLSAEGSEEAASSVARQATVAVEQAAEELSELRRMARSPFPGSQGAVSLVSSIRELDYMVRLTEAVGSDDPAILAGALSAADSNGVSRIVAQNAAFHDIHEAQYQPIRTPNLGPVQPEIPDVLRHRPLDWWEQSVAPSEEERARMQELAQRSEPFREVYDGIRSALEGVDAAYQRWKKALADYESGKAPSREARQAHLDYKNALTEAYRRISELEVPDWSEVMERLGLPEDPLAYYEMTQDPERGPFIREQRQALDEAELLLQESERVVRQMLGPGATLPERYIERSVPTGARGGGRRVRLEVPILRPGEEGARRTAESERFAGQTGEGPSESPVAEHVVGRAVAVTSDRLNRIAESDGYRAALESLWSSAYGSRVGSSLFGDVSETPSPMAIASLRRSHIWEGLRPHVKAGILAQVVFGPNGDAAAESVLKRAREIVGEGIKNPGDAAAKSAELAREISSGDALPHPDLAEELRERLASAGPEERAAITEMMNEMAGYALAEAQRSKVGVQEVPSEEDARIIARMILDSAASVGRGSPEEMRAAAQGAFAYYDGRYGLREMQAVRGRVRTKFGRAAYGAGASDGSTVANRANTASSLIQGEADRVASDQSLREALLASDPTADPESLPGEVASIRERLRSVLGLPEGSAASRAFAAFQDYVREVSAGRGGERQMAELLKIGLAADPRIRRLAAAEAGMSAGELPGLGKVGRMRPEKTLTQGTLNEYREALTQALDELASMSPEEVGSTPEERRAFQLGLARIRMALDSLPRVLTDRNAPRARQAIQDATEAIASLTDLGVVPESPFISPEVSSYRAGFMRSLRRNLETPQDVADILSDSLSEVVRAYSGLGGYATRVQGRRTRKAPPFRPYTPRPPLPRPWEAPRR